MEGFGSRGDAGLIPAAILRLAVLGLASPPPSPVRLEVEGGSLGSAGGWADPVSQHIHAGGGPMTAGVITLGKRHLPGTNDVQGMVHVPQARRDKATRE